MPLEQRCFTFNSAGRGGGSPARREPPITLQRLGFVMNYPANPLLFESVMLVPGKPAVIWNTSGESSGASGETNDFLCISRGFAHARFAWLPGPSRLEKDAESKEAPEQMIPVDLLGSGFCQKCIDFHCFRTVFGKP